MPLSPKVPHMQVISNVYFCVVLGCTNDFKWPSGDLGIMCPLVQT